MIGAVSLVLVAACAAPPRPPGGTPPTTTTSAPTTTTAADTSPTTTTTAEPSTTTTVGGSTTTTSAPVPPEPSDTILRLTDGSRDSSGPAVSADGRHVAFESFAFDLVPGDGNTDADVFVWDRSTGTTTLVSEGEGAHPTISGDGRYVVYRGQVTDGAAPSDVFLWDGATGTTTRVTQGDGSSGVPTMSADGRYVAFDSGASNLVPDDGNGASDIFVFDADTGATTRITDGNGASEWAAVSADGRWVAFHSWASDLVPDDTNGVGDVFVWDATSGATTRITDGDRYSAYARISGTGRYVTYTTAATNVSPGNTDEDADVFLWDATTGETSRISYGIGSGSPDISADGRYITYQAYGSDLVPAEGNGFTDVYLWDATTGETSRITDGNEYSYVPVISADGSSIAFQSFATNIVDGDADTNGASDIFLWHRNG